ncbi:hypothetical protein ACXU4B_01475 [Dyella soli]|uniref:Uncharacterized protein n=1 Tax=Dyella soli TaxID=522319 RepID=A0A4V2NLM8_9GAMM|nr:hypothetical protein [Dyella soli]TCI09741.1 hypothetical protein EZM97_12340 [Dyella soli]
MRIVTRLIAMNRGRQLNRQFREIEQAIQAMPRRSRARLGTMALREIGQASRSDFPHLYGTPPEERYLPWGQGTDIGFARARSDNAEVAMRGIALWLAAAFHETKNTPFANLEPHHRQLVRILRELKVEHRADPTQPWMQAPAAA